MHSSPALLWCHANCSFMVILFFYGNMQMPDCAVFCKCPHLTDVYWVLNRLLKAAPTPWSPFQWVGGRPTRHDVTDQHKYNLESMFLGIFCYRHIMIELHFLVFANIHSKPSAVLPNVNASAVSENALQSSPAFNHM